MGEVIPPNAEASRVEEHINESFEAATARGGEVAAAAATRLGPSVAAIEAAAAGRKAANKAASLAWAAVLAEDAKADPGIGGVRDEMYNALGRPKHSTELDQVFPGGIGTYTSGDPTGQPLLMEVLRTRILAGAAPQWTEPARQDWAGKIEALRGPYAAAVEAHRAPEAAAIVAEAGYRAAVRGGHARLRTFKRDLKNLGLTEKQIHEIIPDAGSGRSGGGKGEGGDEGEEGGGAGGSPK